MTTRLGLYLLLPLFALAVYIDGQRYDPSAMDFKGQQTSALTGFLPANLEGLSRDGQPRVFSKDNLFELVNGHAEFFIAAGFKQSAVAGYRAAGDEAGMPVINIDVYDMGVSENAFGVMAEEGAQAEAFDVGFMGVKTGESVMFIKGPYYVKVTAFGNGVEKLSAYAYAVDKAMTGVVSTLPQFDRLPDKGSTGRNYVRKDYLGMDFFAGVFEKKYNRGGEEFSAFVMTPKGGAEALVNKALAFYRQSGAKTEAVGLGNMKGWDIADKYEGSMTLVVSGADVIGVKGLTDGNARMAFLAEAVADAKK
ncbi:MAG: hypothetical protein HQK85_04270 [Nitrospinae bacterium]|nr:hypothetical protein [Nitrospinota bacterium]